MGRQHARRFFFLSRRVVPPRLHASPTTFYSRAVGYCAMRQSRAPDMAWLLRLYRPFCFGSNDGAPPANRPALRSWLRVY